MFFHVRSSPPLKNYAQPDEPIGGGKLIAIDRCDTGEPMTMQGFMRSAMICAALMVATPAYSVDAVLTGVDLYRDCSEHTDLRTIKDIRCQYYIAGVMAGMTVAEQTQRKLCLPQTADPKVNAVYPTTMRLVIEKFLRDNPTLPSQRAEILVARAFYDAFPSK